MSRCIVMIFIFTSFYFTESKSEALQATGFKKHDRVRQREELHSIYQIKKFPIKNRPESIQKMAHTRSNSYFDFDFLTTEPKAVVLNTNRNTQNQESKSELRESSLKPKNDTSQFKKTMTNQRLKKAEPKVNLSSDYFEWEGFYEIHDSTPLNGGPLRVRNLMLLDTGSELGLIAGVFDEELNSRVFRNLKYNSSTNSLVSNESIGYSSLGKIQIQMEPNRGKISGSLEKPDSNLSYEFVGTKKTPVPGDSADPCSMLELKGIYTGLVGDIPGNITIELTETDELSIVFSSYHHSNLATRLDAHYFPSTGRLFMINEDSNYPFVWRLIANKSQSNQCGISGLAYSSFNSSVYSAEFQEKHK